jgi:predicted Zn-dependent peptidase
MKPHGSGVAALLLLLLAATGALPAHAQPDPAPPNPFAGFEGFRLPNGLKVWYGHLQGATMTSMAIIVPAGWDQDPVDGEETAHLLEHVLLGDRHGRLEADLVRELTARGGSYNGVTTPDRTYFPLHIGTDQAAYGIQWLYDVIAPRVLSESLVNVQRDPVAIEIGAGPRQWYERLARAGLRHSALRPAGFWLREFGLSTAQERAYDPYSTLAGIRAADLTAFYETHYSPPQMTLVVVSGAPRTVLQPVIDQTFGLLPWRPPPPPDTLSRPPPRDSRRFSWAFSRSTQVRLMYRIPELNGRDQLRLIFIEDLMRHRLMERLRRGEEKFVYSAQVSTEIRGPVAYLGVAARIEPRHEAQARAIIEQELERIREATSDEVAFYADRDALSRRLRVQNAAPATLVGWATDRFYRPDLHAEFPDLGEYFAGVGPDSISALARRIIVPDNRILRVTRSAPVAPTSVAVLLAITAAAAVRLYRRLVIDPVDMSRIRYVARLRRSWIHRLAGRILAALLLAVALRAVYAVLHTVAERWILQIDSMPLHALLLLGAVFAGAFCTAVVVGLLPRKVLVFEHELRLKSLTYRSVVIPAGAIRAARPLRRSGLRGGPAVRIELVDGTHRTLPTRDSTALLNAIRPLWAEPLHGRAGDPMEGPAGASDHDPDGAAAAALHQPA